jgi:predicted ATP-dependent serine protease
MPPDDRSEKLTDTLRALQTRFGERIIAPATQASALQTLPFGFADLDAQIGGGLLPGRLSVLIGSPTSGATTLALSALAQAQNGGSVAYVDLASRFDPPTAHAHGIDLASLLLTRPSLSAVPAIIRDLLSANGALVIVDAIDTPLRLNAEDARRFATALKRSSSALLWLVSVKPDGLDALTDIRLRCQRLAWIQRDADIIGLHVRVIIDKDRAGGGGRAVQLTISFGSTS